MLAEWLEKEAGETLVKTAAQQFENELSALDAPSIARVWRAAKKKEAQSTNFPVLHQPHLDPGTAARHGALMGGLGGTAIGGLQGAGIGAQLGGPGGALMGGLAGMGLGGGLGAGIGAGSGALGAHLEKKKMLANAEALQEMEEEASAKKKGKTKKSSAKVRDAYAAGRTLAGADTIAKAFGKKLPKARGMKDMPLTERAAIHAGRHRDKYLMGATGAGGLAAGYAAGKRKESSLDILKLAMLRSAGIIE